MFILTIFFLRNPYDGAGGRRGFSCCASLFRRPTSDKSAKVLPDLKFDIASSGSRVGLTATTGTYELEMKLLATPPPVV